jgi:hypothetical protein
MEQAIFISKVKDLEYVTLQYSRLYFGIEFCQNLIPTMEDLEYILRFISEKEMYITLVTPYVNNRGIEKLKLLSEYLITHQPQSEIVINDWGFLNWIHKRYPNLNLVLGRLLTKQKRGPRILKLIDKVSETMVEHFRQSNVDSSLLTEFLINKGIKRVEFDNPFQGLSRPSHSLKGSLYTPFVYVTTTRFCPTTLGEKRINKPLRAILPCNKGCQRYTFRLTHTQMPVELLLKGNTQFFKNEYLPKDLDQLTIDRLVYQPTIPL